MCLPAFLKANCGDEALDRLFSQRATSPTMNNNKLASKLPTTARKYALDWLNILGHQKSSFKKNARTVGYAYGLVRYCTVHHIASARGRGVLGSWNGQIDIDWMPGTITSDFP